MPKKSIYNYKEVKDIAYKTIKSEFNTPILFRQLQFQSILVFLPSDYNSTIIKKLLIVKNTNWYFIVVCDNYMFNIIKNDKDNGNKDY
jgi:hypothetical protein